jgi:hypothetical protein
LLGFPEFVNRLNGPEGKAVLDFDNVASSARQTRVQLDWHGTKEQKDGLTVNRRLDSPEITLEHNAGWPVPTPDARMLTLAVSRRTRLDTLTQTDRNIPKSSLQTGGPYVGINPHETQTGDSDNA